ncbi:hypothetical protein INR49_004365, partial [Caranx melampygus]
MAISKNGFTIFALLVTLLILKTEILNEFSCLVAPEHEMEEDLLPQIRHRRSVCHQNGTNFQCICEDEYVWSHVNCMTYGACDEIINETCTCINSIPTNGEYCQPKTALLVEYEYLTSIELNVSDVSVINRLRTILSNISYPISISSNVQLFEVNITTVCSPSGAGF